MASIAVAGGGMCGLAAAMMLADDGHDVVVIERDEAPPPDPEAAFNQWRRRSVAQFGLAHWLHARGTAVIREQLPTVYGLLEDNGAFPFNLVKALLSKQPGGTIEAADDRFDQLTGRRSTLEWAMATAAAKHQGVTVRRGESIAGFDAGPPRSGVPSVTGLVLDSGEVVQADLVIDATGRRSATPTWLAAIGAAAPIDVGEDSGFAYYGRYFRSTDGTMPAMLAPLLSPMGSFSVLTLPADNGTWSVTLYGLSSDKPLRAFRDGAVHDRVIRACPLHAHWLNGEPISEMASMMGIADRQHRFVVDGQPCATGVLSVGDASSCTNPSLGRGITLGLMHVEILRAVVADHLHDQMQLALEFDRRTEAELTPWHEATVAMDRRRLAEMNAHVAGREIEPEPAQQIGDLLAAAASRDPIAARTYAELFSCNATPAEVFARPGLLDHLLSLAPSVPVEPLPGPDRPELLDLVS